MGYFCYQQITLFCAALTVYKLSSLDKVCVCVGGCDVDGNRCSVSRNSFPRGGRTELEEVDGGLSQVSANRKIWMLLFRYMFCCCLQNLKNVFKAIHHLCRTICVLGLVVCLSAGLWKKYLPDFHETWWKTVAWGEEEPIKGWSRSKSRGG